MSKIRIQLLRIQLNNHPFISLFVHPTEILFAKGTSAVYVFTSPDPNVLVCCPRITLTVDAHTHHPFNLLCRVCRACVTDKGTTSSTGASSDGYPSVTLSLAVSGLGTPTTRFRAQILCWKRKVTCFRPLSMKLLVQLIRGEVVGARFLTPPYFPALTDQQWQENGAGLSAPARGLRGPCRGLSRIELPGAANPSG